jgi:putative ABC transport system ATP-binding protein
MVASKTAVEASSLGKIYKTGLVEVEVLRDVNFVTRLGEFAVLSGPSGSGKTTLLNIVSGIDKPTSGRITVFNEDLVEKDEDFLARFRCDNIGYVFQAYNLVSTLTVAENVAFPMEWLRRTEDHIEKRVEMLLELVGLQERAEHFPFQLSGGEQQRVAFARALANDPPLFLVDEPTGNLDAKTSLKITGILQTLKDDGKTLIVATHDSQILQMADRRFFLEDGNLRSQDE